MLKTRERSMFPKPNVTGDIKDMSYRIIEVKSLLGYTIAKEAAKTSTRLELRSFMRWKRDKVRTTKNPKRGEVMGLTIEELGR